MKLEGRNHSLEDRFGAFERGCDHEEGVGVRPGGDEERDNRAPLGEGDIDMTEVGFKALTREMAQGDECLPVALPMLEDIPLYLSIPAKVAVFVAEATKDLGSGVPLLGRRGLIVGEDLVDDRQEGAELGRVAFPNHRNWLAVRKGLPNLTPDLILGMSSAIMSTFDVLRSRCRIPHS
jgi:hypothetical protein